MNSYISVAVQTLQAIGTLALFLSRSKEKISKFLLNLGELVINHLIVLLFNVGRISFAGYRRLCHLTVFRWLLGSY